MRTAQEIIKIIAEFPRFPKDERFQRIRSILKDLEHPELSTKFIHIAGTNGKGSTAVLMAKVLREAGYKVGLFTSPHLFDWRERIRVNEESISEEQIQKFGTLILNYELGAFEAWFLMALLCFREEKVDFAILEAGIGGRLDVTNVIPSPEVSVLTNVDLEHTEILGGTREEIFEEKRAIQKESVLVTGVTDPHLIQGLARVRVVKGKGDFRQQNEAVAREALQVLRERGVEIHEAAFEAGFKNFYWPLRMEILREAPLVLVDGAHNLHGVKGAVAALPPKTSKKRWLWMGISTYKAFAEMVPLLTKDMDHVVISEASYHAARAEDLAPYAVNPVLIPNISEAASWLISQIKEEEELFIMGGLYFASEAVVALRALSFLPLEGPQK